MDLSKEEVEALAKSPVCLKCEHKAILHNIDCEYGVECYVCKCDELIVEGNYNSWGEE